LRTTTAAAGAEIRGRLAHPVIDADGHTIESMPVVFDYMRDVGGAKFLDHYKKWGGGSVFNGPLHKVIGPHGWYDLSPEERRSKRVTRAGFWGLPTVNTRDRAAVMAPKLFRERLDELGIDFAVVYGTLPLSLTRTDDEEIRRVGCRAVNKMYADMFGPHSDRMTVPAAIPMYTPQEAIEELEYVVQELGLKAVMVGNFVRRQVDHVAREHPEAAPYAVWADQLAMDSAYDYDPFWKRCVELKVVPAAHAGSNGFGTRASVENWVYNHVGHFAAAGEAFCKALVLGGVTHRFPTLRFAFLEGGVAWACNLYNDLIAHWETRNVESMLRYLDPNKLNGKELARYLGEYGGKQFAPHLKQIANAPPPDTSREGGFADDWPASGIRDAREVPEIFSRFFFGCEAEDRMTAVAFNPKINHFGAKIQAMFSSDVGHFDVRDISTVLVEAYELVEDGLLSESDFRDFTFANVATMYRTANPDFFQGTVVEEAVRETLP